MNEVYTSYYARAKSLSPERWEFVQISNSLPKWWEYPVTLLSSFVPPWYIVELFKQHLDANMFVMEYNLWLKKNEEQVKRDIETLKKLAEKKNVVLLCYEPPHEFCHRSHAAKVIEELTGIEINELYMK